MFVKPSARGAIAVLLVLATACSSGSAQRADLSDSSRPSQAPVAPTRAQAAPALPPAAPALPPASAPTPDFAAVSQLINDAIAAHKLPGAVVVIGHGGRVVFHQAFGSRKLAGEPGLDGSPAPAEPMTECTDLDMASLTTLRATATVVMQLYEQGKAQFHDPVQQ